MLFKLFLIFAVIPVVELAILIKVGSSIGILNTVVIILLTATVGAFMVRNEGISVLARIHESMRQGIFPEEDLISGAMILVAGALLLTPGFFTDIIGFCMVIPVSRNFIMEIIKRRIKKKISSDDIEINIQ